MAARRQAAPVADAPPVDQPAAIAERGELELKLAGVTYRLRPSHAALKAIERKTDISVVRLASLGNTQSLTLDQLGIIASELIRAGAEDDLTRRVDPDRISELMMEAGLFGPIATLTICLIDAISGGRTASGEAKAAVA